MCIYIYTYIYVYICTYICVCIYIYVYINIQNLCTFALYSRRFASNAFFFPKKRVFLLNLSVC